MARVINKEMSVDECYKIVLWYYEQIKKKENEKDNILEHLSNLLQWKLRRNIATIQDVAIDFDNYRKSVKETFDKKWMNSEKVEHTPDNSIKVKDEYLDEFKIEIKKMIDEMNAVLKEKSTFQITVMDIESEIENVINKIENPDFNEIEVLFFMDDSSSVGGNNNDFK